MANINFIVHKPASGFIIDTVIAPSDIVSQYDSNMLYMALEGFTGAVTVKLDFVLPDGTELTEVHLSSSISEPKIFSLALGSDVLGSFAVGEEGNLIIKNISVSNLGYTYKSEDEYPIRMYLTNTSTNYMPDDIDNIYILINKLQEQLKTIL